MKNQEVSNALDAVLAQLYTLYARTQDCRWRMNDSVFDGRKSMLDRMGDKQAREIECIGLLFQKVGARPQGDWSHFQKMADYDREGAGAQTGQDVIKELIGSHEKVVSAAENVLTKVAIDDETVTSFATEQIISHQNDIDRLNKVLARSDVGAVVKVI